MDVLFTFDATGLEATSVVVFETLFQGETTIAEHCDLEDEGQTITFTELPRIGTTATVDGSHTADPTGEITIVDVVEYSGLYPRRNLHRFPASLWTRARARPLLVDGCGSHRRDGVRWPRIRRWHRGADLHPGRQLPLAGTTIVVFETLYQDGVEIVSHADINDESQTIVVNPKGGLLIRKTSEDGVLEGFTFLVEGEGYSQTYHHRRRRGNLHRGLGPRRVHHHRAGKRPDSSV